MMTDPLQIKDIKQLRQFVSHTLCKQNDFEEGIFQVTEKILTRGTQLCGIFFCLHSVWETNWRNCLMSLICTGSVIMRAVLLVCSKNLMLVTNDSLVRRPLNKESR